MCIYIYTIVPIVLGCFAEMQQQELSGWWLYHVTRTLIAEDIDFVMVYSK